MQPGRNQEQGFTLIEVLAAIVILSIVSLVLTSYFTQAMTYSKSNQNKTIMVNLARNALFYMEKQDFDKMKVFLDDKNKDVLAADCRPGSCGTSDYSDAFEDTEALSNILNLQINNIWYSINIIYQPALLSGTSESSGSSTVDKSRINEYLLPIKAVVTRVDGGNQPNYTVNVEGYITDERIR
ncbi:prepilin-type N-terminal cleavage/methylation domain-containing protein [Paenibacillus sp. sgz500958]|uniref:type IV pilus modification PilV family protein n=1 Tax=Paenibacillus sp. sgz500958 TaxID=3242475 RepID=UPI0036D42DA1